MFRMKSRSSSADGLSQCLDAAPREGPRDKLLLKAILPIADDGLVTIYARDLRRLICDMQGRVAAQTSLRMDAQAEAQRNLERAQAAEEDPGDLCIRFDWETGTVRATDPAGRLGLDGISDVLSIVGRVLRGVKADCDRRDAAVGWCRPRCPDCKAMSQACDNHS